LRKLAVSTTRLSSRAQLMRTGVGDHFGQSCTRSAQGNGRLPLKSFLDAMDARTRVVSTAYITYGNGFRVDLPELGAAYRERDIRLVVDGVQAAGIIAAPQRAHIVNIRVANAASIMNRLRQEQRIIVNVTDDAILISMSFFDTENEIERTVHAIARLSGAISAAVAA